MNNENENEEKGTFETWTEEVTVAGGDLYDTMKEMLKDASAYRMRVVNKRTEEVVFDIPVALGVGAALILQIWAVIGAAVLYVADFRIVVEHRQVVTDDIIIEDDLANEIVIHDANDVVAETETEPVAEAAAPVEELTVADTADAERCQGFTKSGSQCKRKPMEGSAYCYAHKPV